MKLHESDRLDADRHRDSGIFGNQATSWCEFTVGRIANPYYNHSVLNMFPSTGRLNSRIRTRPFVASMHWRRTIGDGQLATDKGQQTIPPLGNSAS